MIDKPPGYYSSDLKSKRPDLRLADFLCCKCKKAPDMLESTAVHYAEGNLPNGKGAVLAVVTCHGAIESCEISFEAAAKHTQSEEKIPVFDSKPHYPPGEGFESAGFRKR